MPQTRRLQDQIYEAGNSGPPPDDKDQSGGMNKIPQEYIVPPSQWGSEPSWSNNPDDVLKSIEIYDPETAGSAAASKAMEPVTGKYLGDVASGRMALSGIQSTNEAFKNQDYAALAGQFAGLPLTLGGVGAKTANMDANAIATLMEVAGARPETIFKQTGWYRDVDNQWKFEISDKGASLNEDAFNLQTHPLHKDQLQYELSKKQPTTPEGLPRPKTLGDVLHHPELFKAYPEAVNVPVDSLPDYKFGGGLKGSMRNDGSVMGLAPDLPNEVLSTTLHETQHWIQNKEGFARGGAPDEFIPAERWAQRVQDHDDRRTLENQLDVLEGFDINPYHVEEAFKTAIRRDDISPALQGVLNKLEQSSPELFAQAHKVYSKELAWDNLQRDAFNQYLTLAGESESRNVELRHKYPDITESTIPTQTAPVRGKDQIIKMQGER